MFREGKAIGELYLKKMIILAVENLVNLGITQFAQTVKYYKIQVRVVELASFAALAKEVLKEMENWDGDELVSASLRLIKAAYCLINNL
jgi:hypothetical protein